MMTDPRSILNSSKRSSDSASFDGSDSIPEMVKCASFQSDSDNDSLSSSVQSSKLALSPVISPRSIFESYWLSPSRKNTPEETNDDGEDDVMVSLQTLLVPSVNNDVGSDDVRANSSAAASRIVQAPTISRFTEHEMMSSDDICVDYQSALASNKRTGTPRRQILPTPPPLPSLSSLPIQQKRQRNFLLSPLGGERKCSSSTALLKEPNQSCLRRSRYSSSSIVAGIEAKGSIQDGLCNNRYQDLHHLEPNYSKTAASANSSGNSGPDNPRDEIRKSVSFYSEVSVLEFSVPQIQQKSQKGWSKYFA